MFFGCLGREGTPQVGNCLRINRNYEHQQDRTLGFGSVGDERFTTEGRMGACACVLCFWEKARFSSDTTPPRGAAVLESGLSGPGKCTVGFVTGLTKAKVVQWSAEGYTLQDGSFVERVPG